VGGCGVAAQDGRPLSHTVHSSDGVELAVHDLGGDGQPLLACHATGFHGRVWEPLARLLDGFHVWAPDFRGHGDSSSLDIDYQWDGFADDVLAIVDDLRLGRPFGLGHSKGAAALLLAEERRPGTFRALYCYEPIVFPADPPPGPMGTNPLAESARRRRETFGSFDEAYDNFASKPPLDELHPEALRAYVDHGFAAQGDGSVRLKCHGEHEARVYEMGSSHGAFGGLGDVRCPVTVACGGDGSPPAAFAPLVADALPNGRLEEFPTLGHFGPLQDPALVAQSVLAAFSSSG
jgi:pimeloyl-ACP methyl ester carboxylesterase